MTLFSVAPKLSGRSIRHIDRKQKLKTWEDRFDDLVTVSRKYASQKLEYIHNNPLQSHWNLVKTAEHYKHSSAMFYFLGKQPPITVTHFMEYF